MVRSGDESGKNPVIFLYFNFNQLAVSHSERKEGKNKDVYFSTSNDTAKTLLKHDLSSEHSISFKLCVTS